VQSFIMWQQATTLTKSRMTIDGRAPQAGSLSATTRRRVRTARLPIFLAIAKIILIIATTTTKNVRRSDFQRGAVYFVSNAVDAFSASDPQSSRSASKILVTGASGKLGRIVLGKLENDPRYEPKALVRSEQSARTLLHNNNHNKKNHNKKKKNSHEIGGGSGDGNENNDDQQLSSCPLEHILIADISSPTFVETTSKIPGLAGGGSDGGGGGSSGIEAMIICTSAVPQIQKRSLVKMALKVPWNFVRRRRPLVDFRSLTFKWKNDGYPEMVDYRGQISQFQLAKALGIPHVVLVSSMGVTDPNNFLNSVGKNKNKKKKGKKKRQDQKAEDAADDNEDEGNGDILVWKRRSERYLATESGIESYTIIHPGGLIDGPGRTTTATTSQNDDQEEEEDKQEEFVFDVDDNLYNQTGVIRQTRIRREDLADLCIAALLVGKNRKMSFDCITRPVTTTTGSSSSADSKNEDDGGGGEGRSVPSPTSSWSSSGKSVAEEALQQFFIESKTSDYAMR